MEESSILTDVPLFAAPTIDMIANILAATDGGLTGTEIGRYLSELGIIDPHEGETKRYRLADALKQQQNHDSNGNCVIRLIERAMHPVGYADNPDQFEARRGKLNTALALCGYFLAEDGKIRAEAAVSTLTEARHRANTLQTQLLQRNVHADVLRFCQAELLQDNYFHAVFEATKSVADKIRRLTGLTADGGKLVDAAFNGVNPRIAINSLLTDTEQSEQKGFANMLKGMFGVFRNTTAHAPKISWPIDEQDALDLMSIASYLHRRIDAATIS